MMIGFYSALVKILVVDLLGGGNGKGSQSKIVIMRL